ncbi:MAG TPA: hypothetical protein VM053_05675 [Gemmatimonadaceae bacterium]|nr:hypothetical protein [Gemmatimonadaceae bacterium]
MRRVLIPTAALLCAAALVAAKPTPPSYLFVWAGDSAGKASDFLVVIDATPSSPRYGEVLTSIPTGVSGSSPHHTEEKMPASEHLLANGFGAGRTWVFDLTKPLKPRVLTSFGDAAGFSHPHSYVRTANGHVLATFQYRSMHGDGEGDMAMHHAGGGMPMSHAAEHVTGGIIEMDERGRVIRSGDARDASIDNKKIYPYSVLPMPAINRAVSTTTDMMGDSLTTSEWIQLWRLSDLKLLKSIALKPGPRGNENRYTGEPRLLPDGKSVYIHTFNCGLYLLRDIDRPEPTAHFVMAFEGGDCGVPILAGHFWIQPVPAARAVVSMDITDPMNPREVSRVKFDEGEWPHWLSIDPTGKRLVMNSGGGKTNRLYVINFSPTDGILSIDDKFRDKGGDMPGISMNDKTWPHGFVGKALPHGSVFSR